MSKEQTLKKDWVTTREITPNTRAKIETFPGDIHEGYLRAFRNDEEGHFIVMAENFTTFEVRVDRIKQMWELEEYYE